MHPGLARKKQPLGLKSGFRWQLRSLALTSEITRFDKPAMLAWKSKGSGIRAITVWTFVPDTEGTLVRCEQSVQGLMVYVWKQRTTLAMQDTLDRWLEALKAALVLDSLQKHS